MDAMDKLALQVAKEVVIKFIEVGRISPGNFGQTFAAIYRDVLVALSGAEPGGTSE